MRQYSHQPYGAGEVGRDEQNFSNLIDRVDRLGSEETKIMTFKSQDNGFMQMQ